MPRVINHKRGAALGLFGAGCMFLTAAGGRAQAPDNAACAGTTAATRVVTVGDVDPVVVENLANCATVDMASHSPRTMTRRQTTADVFVMQGESTRFDESRPWVDDVLAQGAKLVLLDADADALSHLAGISGPGLENVVLRNHRGHLVVTPVGVPPLATQVTIRGASSASDSVGPSVATMNVEGTPPVDSAERLQRDLLWTLGRAVHPHVDVLVDQGVRIASSAASGLPFPQFLTRYIELPRSGVVHDDSDDSQDQRFTNSVVFEYTLVSSVNPAAKFLRLVTMGAGMSPTSGRSMRWDDEHNRGFFQNKVNIAMASLDSGVTLMDHSPSNVNGSTEYTASSQLSVGVDVSKNPGFNGSYTVGSSQSRQTTDFAITNRSFGTSAAWDYELSHTRSNKFDMFESHTFYMPTVRGLPDLAKANMQPTCVSVWKVDGSEQGAKRFHLGWTVEYMRAWVSGDYWSNTKHWQTRTYQSTSDDIYFDFSGVNPSIADGEYKLRVKASNRHLAVDSDGLVTSYAQPDSAQSRFQIQYDAFSRAYRIKTVSSDLYLHEDGGTDKLVSTRYQPHDDFTRFFFHAQNDGSYRMQVKADQLFLHEDGNGDRILSTRYQPDDDFTRFYLEGR